MQERIYVDDIRSVVYVVPLQVHRKKMIYGPKMPAYELVYKISGESVTHFNGKVMHNLPETVEYLPKCEKADYYVERKVLGDCIDIHFNTSRPMPTEAFRVDCRGNKRIGELFLKLYRLWVGKQRVDDYRCMALMYEILSELFQQEESYLSRDQNRKISRGVSYLQEHAFDFDIDYYEPARLCNICYTYFKRLFAQKYGLTPSRYVAKLRLERGAELLGSGQYNVTEVAALCGYDNIYYFSRCFKEAYGVPPSRYPPK
ncbi:MAG: helix-turn-helix transcriptional regulator [Clostridia bacterium]|nr:helix-turn-helix transcriptional regulator [Clostridia bacterium]